MEAAAQKGLPGYRGVLTTIGAAYVLLAVMNVAQGAAKVLEPFSVPDDVMKSGHFLDPRVEAQEEFSPDQHLWASCGVPLQLR